MACPPEEDAGLLARFLSTEDIKSIEEEVNLGSPRHGGESPDSPERSHPKGEAPGAGREAQLEEMEHALHKERQRVAQKDRDLKLMKRLLAKVEESFKQQSEDAQLERDRLVDLEVKGQRPTEVWHQLQAVRDRVKLAEATLSAKESALELKDEELKKQAEKITELKAQLEEAKGASREAEERAEKEGGEAPKTGELDKLEACLAEAEADLAAKTAELDDLEARLAAAEADVAAKVAELREKDAELARQASRIQELEASGAAPDIEALLAEKDAEIAAQAAELNELRAASAAAAVAAAARGAAADAGAGRGDIADGLAAARFGTDDCLPHTFAAADGDFVGDAAVVGGSIWTAQGGSVWTEQGEMGGGSMDIPGSEFLAGSFTGEGAIGGHCADGDAGDEAATVRDLKLQLAKFAQLKDLMASTVSRQNEGMSAMEAKLSEKEAKLREQNDTLEALRDRLAELGSDGGDSVARESRLSAKNEELRRYKEELQELRRAKAGEASASSGAGAEADDEVHKELEVCLGTLKRKEKELACETAKLTSVQKQWSDGRRKLEERDHRIVELEAQLAKLQLERRAQQLGTDGSPSQGSASSDRVRRDSRGDRSARAAAGSAAGAAGGEGAAGADEPPRPLQLLSRQQREAREQAEREQQEHEFLLEQQSQQPVSFTRSPYGTLHDIKMAEMAAKKEQRSGSWRKTVMSKLFSRVHSPEREDKLQRQRRESAPGGLHSVEGTPPTPADDDTFIAGVSFSSQGAFEKDERQEAAQPQAKVAMRIPPTVMTPPPARYGVPASIGLVTPSSGASVRRHGHSAACDDAQRIGLGQMSPSSGAPYAVTGTPSQVTMPNASGSLRFTSTPPQVVMPAGISSGGGSLQYAAAPALPATTGAGGSLQFSSLAPGARVVTATSSGTLPYPTAAGSRVVMAAHGGSLQFSAPITAATAAGGSLQFTPTSTSPRVSPYPTPMFQNGAIVGRGGSVSTSAPLEEGRRLSAALSSPVLDARGPEASSPSGAAAAEPRSGRDTPLGPKMVATKSGSSVVVDWIM